MSEIVIRAEGLGKKYFIGHKAARERYTAMRDVMARTAKRLVRTAVDAVRGRELIVGDQIEEFWALKDVSLEVKQGDVVGIVGRNGAGKSTLLKIFSRITEPSEGRLSLKGRVASLLEVGTGLHPELTGRENIYLNGAILGMTRAEITRKFDEIVNFAEVEKFLDTPVKRYSSGMYVRLAFAVAAHLEPEILVVDEVLAVGDAEFQKKCLGKMQDVAGQGRTVLFVSHNISAVKQLCSRGLLLAHGKVVADGSAHETLIHYLSDAKSGNSIDLTDWTDRRSTGEARITKFEFWSDCGDTAIFVNSTVNFKIHARFRDPLHNPTFGIIIHDALGEPLLDVRSIHSGLRLNRVFDEVVVEVSIPNLGLYPGRYLLSPWIADSTCSRDVDFPRLCAAIDIQPTPGEHGDLKLDSTWGKYFVASQWKSCMEMAL